MVPALGMTGLSNDRASVCDEFINPQYATVTQVAGYEAYNCTGPDRRDDWVNRFARATGLQTSWVLGYRFGAGDSGPRWRHVRTEVEYFYRTTTYDQTVAVPGLSAGSGSVTADSLNQELQTATDYLGRVASNTLFANLYWDIRTRSRFTPYVGVGLGIGIARDDLRQPVVQERKSHRNHHRRGASQHGRDSPELGGHNKQFPWHPVRPAGPATRCSSGCTTR